MSKERKTMTETTNRVGRRLSRGLKLLLLAGLATATSLAIAAPAGATPVWNLSLSHSGSNLAPGGTEELRVYLQNAGDTASEGALSLTVDLPPGLTRHSVVESDIFAAFFDLPPNGWACPGSPGDTTITCTHADPVKPGEWASSPYGGFTMMIVNVNVASDAPQSGTITATATGGGAAPDTASDPVTVSADEPEFGLNPDSWRADFFDPDGNTPDRRAGAHPYQATFEFDMNSIDDPLKSSPTPNLSYYFPKDSLRNIVVDLPPGFVGNPTAVAECSETQLNAAECPPSSQVGRIEFTMPGIGLNHHLRMHQAVYNMVHPKGVITDLAFAVGSLATVHIRATLDPSDYHVKTTVPFITEAGIVFDQKLTIWGVPGDPRHDFDRCIDPSNTAIGSTIAEEGQRCPVDANPKPFLTVPGQCGVNHQITIRGVDSWQSQGVYDTPQSWPPGGAQQTGCDQPRFDPEVQVHPISQAANSPSGLDVHIEIPQNLNPNALDTAHVKSTEIAFPKGMTVSPSFADGLQACSLQEVKLGTNEPVDCPPASRIGSVDLNTPLLPDPLEGSMFLAKQSENPFGSLLAMYMVIHDNEERAVLLKVAGRIDLDPTTGQILTRFDDLPQLPFEDFNLHFRSGPRAPLINPPNCGSHTIGIEVASWAEPNSPVDVSDTYRVTEGPNGTPCANNPADRPFDPKISGGTVNPQAGSFSPFLFRMTRTDADQELSQIGVTVPPGLTAKLAGIPFCPEAAIAGISSDLATGLGELNTPRCPPASQIGTVSAGVGAGSGPNYFPGKLYLAGPYKGAPLSLAVVIAGLAGPFDLGNVSVRTALHVNPETAQVRALSDPFPLIFHGVLLRVRDVRINLDRKDTALNPTNCNPLSIDAHITGTGGDILTTADDTVADRSERFQVANCAALSFKPKLSFKLKGGTKRGQFPAFQATLKARPGDANIAKSTVVLPRSEFIEQGHIRTVCTRVQFKAEACPEGSIYGHAKAISPLFDEVLEGPVYLRSNGGERVLPDLVVSLNGKIDVALAGFIDSVKGEGRVRNTFDVIPDAPVTKFVLNMRGGKRGLLVNHLDLCEVTSRAEVKLVGQNGKVAQSRPKMGTSCAGKGRRGRQR